MGGPGSGRKKGAGGGKLQFSEKLDRKKGTSQNAFNNASFLKTKKVGTGQASFIASSVKAGKGNKLLKSMPGQSSKIKRTIRAEYAGRRRAK